MDEPAGAASAPAEQRSAWAQTFHSLSYREFRVLWLTTVLTAGGMWLQQVSLGWLAYDMTQSALHVAGVLAARTLPLLLTPLAGVLADRVDRRRLLLVDSLLISALVTGFSVLLFTGTQQVWHLYVFSVTFGLMWAVNNPVRQTLVASSVPGHALMNALALNSMGFNSMRVVGPAIGGYLIVFFGPAINFGLQGVLFGAVFFLLIGFRLRYPGGGQDDARSKSVFRNLAEGFSYVVHSRITLAVTLMTVALALAVMSVVQNQLPVFSAEVLGDAEGGVLGLLFTALGVGGLAGTILIARFSHYRRKGVQGLAAFAGAAVSLLVLSQVSALWAAMASLVALQLFTQAVLTTNMTVVQAIAPDRLRGRVIGVYQMEIGLSPVGGVIAGAIASEYGVSNAFLIGGIAAVVMFVAFAVAYRELRELRL